ncbi:syntaxin-52-like [Populus alba x Populus x berolinensis]|uniref:Syntaxin-52-like n=1 Tax=Populus alba x Populus x berolinensis TaxID=444605 RepID=A0AAD6QKP1_9ROSI|nr:syntaxin-52-like [Populus alba x Populus x berolinensis]
MSLCTRYISQFSTNHQSLLVFLLSAMISGKNSLPQSGPETQRQFSAARRKATILRTKLDILQSLLSALPSKQPLSGKEMNRRQEMLKNLSTKVNQMAGALNMFSAANRENLLGPDSKTDDVINRASSFDNQGLVEQDEGLEKLEETVVSTKHIALAVNEELTLHTRLLDDLDEHVDVTNSRLQRVQKNLAILNKRTKGGCACWVFLAIAIVILIVVVWLLIKYLLFWFSTNMIAKSWAIYQGILLAQKLGCFRLELESDSMEAIRHIWKLLALITLICQSFSTFKLFRIGIAPSPPGRAWFLLADKMGSGLLCHIPSAIFNISSLQLLYLDANKLSGGLPTDICNHLPLLEELVLQGNQLSGQIPPCLCKCRQLRSLSMLGNNFDGNLTRDIGNLSMFTEMLFGRQHVRGIAATLKWESLQLSTYFYVNDCKLNGNIPSETGNLSNLIGLALTKHNFAGSIPSTMEGLRNIQLLDLSRNKLNGSILPFLCLARSLASSRRKSVEGIDT